MRVWMIVISVSLTFGGCREAPPASKTAADVNSPPSAAAAGDGGSAAAPTEGAPAVAVAPAAASTQKPKPAKVRVIVKSVPPKAWVSWGKKKLGETPVIVERPRESGPMDLEVRADGYFTVHTRAYTFHNDVVWVRLTKLTDKMSLFGARQELEPSPSPEPAQ